MKFVIPSCRLFSSLYGAICPTSLTDHHCWTSNQICIPNRWFSATGGWLKQMFNLVCISCVSLCKSIHFVSRVFLKFILWGVCHTYMGISTSACTYAPIGWSGVALSHRVVWQVNFHGSSCCTWHKGGFKLAPHAFTANMLTHWATSALPLTSLPFFLSVTFCIRKNQ